MKSLVTKDVLPCFVTDRIVDVVKTLAEGDDEGPKTVAVPVGDDGALLLLHLEILSQNQRNSVPYPLHVMNIHTMGSLVGYIFGAYDYARQFSVVIQLPGGHQWVRASYASLREGGMR